MVWYRIEECQELLERDPVAANALLAEIRKQVDTIREQDVRELSHRLHPSIIRAGLLPALEVLAEEMPHLDVAILPDESVRQLDDPLRNAIPEAVRLTAYRVVEEALGNVAKHASATRVEVALRLEHLEHDRLVVIVSDNGRGFQQLPEHHDRGLGLNSIAARVERIGGEWSIRSEIGRGTSLSVSLPLSVEQAEDGLSAETALGQEGRPETDGRRPIASVV
jgi:signal transduction histidine kinase